MVLGMVAYYLGHWSAFTWPFHTMNQTISALICTAMAQIIFWCLTLTRAAQWNSAYFGLASLSMYETLFIGFCHSDSKSGEAGQQSGHQMSLKPILNAVSQLSHGQHWHDYLQTLSADATVLKLHHLFTVSVKCEMFQDHMFTRSVIPF